MSNIPRDALRSGPNAYVAAYTEHVINISKRVYRVRGALSALEFQTVYEDALSLGISIQAGKAHSPHNFINAYKDVASALAEESVKGVHHKTVGASAHDIFTQHRHHCQLMADARQEIRANDLRMLCTRAIANPESKPETVQRSRELLNQLATNARQTEHLCLAGVQQCDVRATALLAIDSLYDINPETLATAMHRSRAYRCAAVMLLPIEFSCGVDAFACAKFKVSWARVNEDNKLDSAGQYIVFAHRDGSNGYRHDYDTMCFWATQAGYHSAHGNLMIERQRFGPYDILTINLVRQAAVYPSIQAANAGRHRIVNIYYVLYHLGLSTRVPNAQHFVIASTLYRDLEQHAVNRDGKQWTRPMFASYVRSLSTTIWVGASKLTSWDAAALEAIKDEQACTSLFIHFSTIREASNNATELMSKFRGAIYKTGEQGVCSAILSNITQKSRVSAALGVKINTWSKICNVFSNIGLLACRALECVTLGAYTKSPDDVEKALLDWIATPTSTRYQRIREKRDPLGFLLDPSGEAMGDRWDLVSLAGHSFKEQTVFRAENCETPLVDHRSTLDAFIAGATAEYRTIVAPAEVAHAESKLRERELMHLEDRALYTAIYDGASVAVSCEKLFKGTIRIVQGGPGCGKTRAITDFVQNQQLGACAVIVGSRTACTEITSRMPLDGDKPMAKVYTPHSAMKQITSTKPRYILVDEAFLEHPGKALICAALVDASEIVLVGDYKQITYKDRDIGGTQLSTSFRWHQLVGYVSERTLFENYRLPIPIVKALNDRFGYDMVAKSTKMGEFTYEKFGKLEDIPCYPGFRIVTMLQAIKFHFTKLTAIANTAHEAEGLTWSHVQLVITPEHVDLLLNDPGYIIVGLSRHTDSLRVCVVDGDYLNITYPGSTATMESLLNLANFCPAVIMPRITATKPMTYAAADDGNVREKNLSYDVVELHLREFMGKYDDNGLVFDFDEHGVVSTTSPEPACVARIDRSKMEFLPEASEYVRLSKSALLAAQDTNNPAQSINTMLSRNGGSRQLVGRVGSAIADRIHDDVRNLFFTKPATPLTQEELNQGIITHLHNITERQKDAKYTSLDEFDFPVAKIEGFIKNQLKSQWSRYDSDAFDRVLAAAAAKPGQGIAAWSPATNVVFGGFVAALEKRRQEELQPWVFHATGMSNSDMQHHMEQIMQRYGILVAFIGDDVLIAVQQADGSWMHFWSDISRFDASYAEIHYGLEVANFRNHGMPQQLLDYLADKTRSYNIIDKSLIINLYGIMYGNCSGRFSTLFTNSDVTLSSVSQMYAWRKDADGQVCGVTARGDLRSAVEKLFGFEVKFGAGEIGDFAGNVFANGKVYTDVMRMTAKTMCRRFLLNRALSKEQLAEMVADGYTPAEAPIAFTVMEQGLAIYDRLSNITTVERRRATCMANAAYHFGDTKESERIAFSLAFLEAFSHAANRRYFTQELLKARREHLIFYRENGTEPLNSNYFFLPERESLMLAEQLGVAKSLEVVALPDAPPTYEEATEIVPSAPPAPPPEPPREEEDDEPLRQYEPVHTIEPNIRPTELAWTALSAKDSTCYTAVSEALGEPRDHIIRAMRALAMPDEAALCVDGAEPVDPLTIIRRLVPDYQLRVLNNDEHWSGDGWLPVPYYALSVNTTAHPTEWRALKPIGARDQLNLEPLYSTRSHALEVMPSVEGDARFACFYAAVATLYNTTAAEVRRIMRACATFDEIEQLEPGQLAPPNAAEIWNRLPLTVKLAQKSGEIWFEPPTPFVAVTLDAPDSDDAVPHYMPLKPIRDGMKKKKKRKPVVANEAGENEPAAEVAQDAMNVGAVPEPDWINDDQNLEDEINDFHADDYDQNIRAVGECPAPSDNPRYKHNRSYPQTRHQFAMHHLRAYYIDPEAHFTIISNKSKSWKRMFALGSGPRASHTVVDANAVRLSELKPDPLTHICVLDQALSAADAAIVPSLFPNVHASIIFSNTCRALNSLPTRFKHHRRVLASEQKFCIISSTMRDPNYSEADFIHRLCHESAATHSTKPILHPWNMLAAPSTQEARDLALIHATYLDNVGNWAPEAKDWLGEVEPMEAPETQPPPLDIQSIDPTQP
nr:nonstructural polyprotein [Hepelivirales sp.]